MTTDAGLENDLPAGTEPEGDGAATPAAAAEPDWKAQFEAAAAERAKLNSEIAELRKAQPDSRSLDVIEELREQVKQIGQQQRALITALGEDTLTDLPDAVAKIEANASRDAVQRAFTAQWKDIWADMQDAVRDADGTEIFDLYKAPELEPVRLLWADTKRDMESGAISVADAIARFGKGVSQAHKLTKAEVVKRERAEVLRLKAEAKAAKEEGLDLDTGAPAGGGEPGGVASYFKYLKSGGALPPPEEIDRITAKYLK